MVLIHCALLCEAQAFIEFYKLECIERKRVYKNKNIILVVLGIGKDNTYQLKDFLNEFQITKAINIGVVGSSDRMLEMGKVFICTKQKSYLKYIPLHTVDKPQINNTKIQYGLYDMEGKYFFNIACEYLSEKNVFIFKVISDYLDDTILPKDIVKNMIQKNIKSIDEYIR
jgi:purine-nucleoside phosphorylase